MTEEDAIAFFAQYGPVKQLKYAHMHESILLSLRLVTERIHLDYHSLSTQAIRERSASGLYHRQVCFAAADSEREDHD